MFDLIPHPDTPCSAITSITVELERPTATMLMLRYQATGALANIVVPDEVEPGFQDGLWRETCFEAFIGRAGRPDYVEYNFSPSGRYAAYSFDDYRTDVQQLINTTISNHVRAFGTTDSIDGTTDWIELCWRIELSSDCDNYQIGLSAVMAGIDGTKSYWALAHAPGPPDFHNRDCFIATLPAPSAP